MGFSALPSAGVVVEVSAAGVAAVAAGLVASGAVASGSAGAVEAGSWPAVPAPGLPGRTRTPRPLGVRRGVVCRILRGFLCGIVRGVLALLRVLLFLAQGKSIVRVRLALPGSVRRPGLLPAPAWREWRQGLPQGSPQHGQHPSGWYPLRWCRP